MSNNKKDLSESEHDFNYYDSQRNLEMRKLDLNKVLSNANQKYADRVMPKMNFLDHESMPLPPSIQSRQVLSLMEALVEEINKVFTDDPDI